MGRSAPFMSTRIKPTEEDGKRSLIGHATEKACEARQIYGGPTPGLSPSALNALLEDNRFVRYPVRIAFDATPLQSGEFAFTQQNDPESPSAGFTLYVHPRFENDDTVLPMLVVYHLVSVNYGEIASAEAAEIYGSTLMGLDTETYYQELCRAADSLAPS